MRASAPLVPRGVLTAFAFLLAACGASPTSFTAMPADSTFRVGRLSVSLPASAHLADGSSGGTHDWTPVQEQPWPADLALQGRERDDARAADWAARGAEAERRVSDARQSAENGGLPGEHIRLDERAVDVDGGRWARVLQWPDYTGQWVHIVMVADAGPVRLVVDDRASTSAASETIDRFARVLGAYVLPDASGYGTEDWLYLRHGAIARPPAGREMVVARFNGVPPFEDWSTPDATGLSVSMTTRLVPTAEEPSLLERWREAQGVGVARMFRQLLPRGLSADAAEVRAGPKAAGGGALDGEEVVSEFRMDSADEGELGATLQFEWEHRGRPDEPSAPDVRVDGSTAPVPRLTRDQRAAALAAWDGVLSGVHLTTPQRP